MVNVTSWLNAHSPMVSSNFANCYKLQPRYLIPQKSRFTTFNHCLAVKKLTNTSTLPQVSFGVLLLTVGKWGMRRLLRYLSAVSIKNSSACTYTEKQPFHTMRVLLSTFLLRLNMI